MLKSFSSLCHVGTFNPAHRKHNSQEGAAVSVSEVPEAWLAIARLGSAPVWELKKPENKFLDLHQMSKQQVQSMHEWGLAEGYVVAGTVWQLQTDEYFSWFLTKAEAELEKDCEDQDVTEVPALLPQPKLIEAYWARKSPMPILLTKDILALAYADSLELDGVFWNEQLNVAAYSAPRAAILPSKIPFWAARVVKAAC